MKNIQELEKKALQIRKDIIEMSYGCGREIGRAHV